MTSVTGNAAYELPGGRKSLDYAVLRVDGALQRSGPRDLTGYLFC
jgi:hypothetical protein